MEDIIAVLLTTIILVYLVCLMRALWQPARVPIEESLDQFANYPSELVIGGRRRSNVQVAPCHDQYNHFRDVIHSLLLLFILSCCVALYLLVCNGHIPEDAPVQEPIQCTNTGNAVTVIRGKDYPPPAD